MPLRLGQVPKLVRVQFCFSLDPTSGASQVALVVKNLPANTGDAREVGSIPGSGRSPGEGNGNPLQYSCLENPMDRGAWRATVHRVARIDMTEQLCSYLLPSWIPNNLCSFDKEGAVLDTHLLTWHQLALLLSHWDNDFTEQEHQPRPLWDDDGTRQDMNVVQATERQIQPSPGEYEWQLLLHQLQPQLLTSLSPHIDEIY